MTLMKAAVAALLFLSGGGAAAADLDGGRLDGVRKALTPLRQSAADAARMPPEFLAARDGLRDWIEARLARFPQNGDTGAFNKALNAEIAAKDLACVEAKAPGYNRCASPGEFNARGFLGLVDAERVRDLLIIQAEIGVACGFDETAYIYEWAKAGWRRLIDTSQTPAAGVYAPEQIQQVIFATPANRPPDALLLAVTGASPVCGGPVQAVHYRVWSAKRGGGSSLAVEGREGESFISRRDPAVSARFDGGEFLVEMNVRSMDAARRGRVAVRRFNFDEDYARRVAPIALTPKDFVEEWLRAPWSVASAWTDARAREELAKIHEEAAANLARASFSGPPQRCEKEDDVVQVGVRFANGERFFRLKAAGGGVFEMRAAESEPAKTCVRSDAGLDTPRSLF
ncbi:MAG: hypothetical protein LCH56_10650 [Proteobacteria bacterium]|nr:hypothetical protein [Pseudomonadota bacterium]